MTTMMTMRARTRTVRSEAAARGRAAAGARSARVRVASRARELLAALAVAVATAAGASAGASAEEVGEVFGRSCAGCHVNGGNVLDGGKTLSSRDLERNLGAVNVDVVSAIIANGKGRMPGYGESCAPKGACTFGPRLSEAEIGCVAPEAGVRAPRKRPRQRRATDFFARLSRRQ